MNPLLLVFLFSVMTAIGGVMTPDFPTVGLPVAIIGLIALIFSSRAYIKSRKETPTK